MKLINRFLFRYYTQQLERLDIKLSNHIISVSEHFRSKLYLTTKIQKYCSHDDKTITHKINTDFYTVYKCNICGKEIFIYE